MERLYTIILCLCLTALCLQGKETAEPLSSSRRGVRTATDVVAVALPVAAATSVLVLKDWDGLKQGALTAVTATAAVYLLKYTVHKRRPDGSDTHSFPSMHSAATFASAAFVQRRFGWKFGAPAYALAAFTAWGRTYARKHDWWDVVTGAAIGAGSAYIYTRPFARKHDLSIVPASDGRQFFVSASFSF